MTRSFRLRLLLALALLSAVLVPGGDARADDCEVLDRNGLPRDCTMTEEFGECGLNAHDSMLQCIGEAYDDHESNRSIGFAWDVTVCQLVFSADLLACGIATPINYFFD